MTNVSPLRVAGIAVKVNWSVLVILWLFTWSLASSLPTTAPGCSTRTYWIAGVCGATILLASLLAHELAHAVVARRAGVTVLDVTLWLLGGVTRLGREAATPQIAFKIAAAGPATSVLLGALFAAAGWLLHSLAVAPIVVGVTWWLAGINVLLGIFNLLPGAPLDGGQVLRAWLWRRDGDATRAGLSAARAGRYVAFLLIAMGLFEIMAGVVVAGVWLTFIGWFILSAAHIDEAQVVTRSALSGVRVADAMTPDPHTAPAWITVHDFIDRYLLGDRHSAYPVKDSGGSIVGLISLSQLRCLPADLRASTTVGDIAVPLCDVATASPEESVTTLLERLAAEHGHRALVVETGRLVGIVTAADLSRLIDIRRLAAPLSLSETRSEKFMTNGEDR